MTCKTPLVLYLLGLFLMVLVPLSGLNGTLANTSVLQLRLDYLVHGLAFAPLVVLWRLGFPGHRLWLSIAAGLVLAVGLEGIQHALPYRAWNVNDAIGNVTGLVAGVGFETIRKRLETDRSLPASQAPQRM